MTLLSSSTKLSHTNEQQQNIRTGFQSLNNFGCGQFWFGQLWDTPKSTINVCVHRQQTHFSKQGRRLRVVELLSRVIDHNNHHLTFASFAVMKSCTLHTNAPFSRQTQPFSTFYGLKERGMPSPKHIQSTASTDKKRKSYIDLSTILFFSPSRYETVIYKMQG